MCHNTNMKKAVLLVLPCVLLLSSCQEITFAFSRNDTHPAGLDNEGGSSKNEDVGPYSYYKGDSIVDDAPGRPLVSSELTFANITESKTNITDTDAIKSYFVDSAVILDSVENPYYFSTKAEGLAFLGAESTYIEGKITLNFNVPVYHMVITARPYSYIQTSFNEEKLIIDNDVAISANSKGFIKLKETANENNDASITSECSFGFTQPVQQISLRVGKRRAILEKIVIYY